MHKTISGMNDGDAVQQNKAQVLRNQLIEATKARKKVYTYLRLMRQKNPNNKGSEW